MPSVYELTGLAAQLADLLDDAEDLGDASILAAVGAFEVDVVAKVGALGHVILTMQDMQAQARRDGERARTAQAAWKRKETRVRGLLQSLLEAHEDLTGSAKVQALYGTATLSRRPDYVTPSELEDWPAQWLRTRTEVVTEPDRDAARAAMDAAMAGGEAVPPGFARVERTSVVWRGAK